MHEPSASTPEAASLPVCCAAGRFVITAEIVPPVSSDREHLMAKALPLRELADAINITDGAGRARASERAGGRRRCSHDAGIEPVLQLTCRDRNRIALQGDLLGAAAAGISNLLILTGDDPKAGDQPDAKPVFDLDSIGLIEARAKCRVRGVLPSGRRSGGKPHFFIGAADMPIDPPPDGSRQRSPPKSPPARASCRRSSAWMPGWCAAMSGGWRSTRHVRARFRS